MTKSELIQYLSVQAKENSFSARRSADMQEVVDSILNHLVEALAAGERVELRGFGSFSLHGISARPGRNPKTGEPVAVLAKKRVHFKPGGEMRREVNHG